MLKNKKKAGKSVLYSQKNYKVQSWSISCICSLEHVQFLQVNNGPFNQTPCGALQQASHVL